MNFENQQSPARIRNLALHCQLTDRQAERETHTQAQLKVERAANGFCWENSTLLMNFFHDGMKRLQGTQQALSLFPV